jgi:hypothetical protein
MGMECRMDGFSGRLCLGMDGDRGLEGLIWQTTTRHACTLQPGYLEYSHLCCQWPGGEACGGPHTGDLEDMPEQVRRTGK